MSQLIFNFYIRFFSSWPKYIMIWLRYYILPPPPKKKEERTVWAYKLATASLSEPKVNSEERQWWTVGALKLATQSLSEPKANSVERQWWRKIYYFSARFFKKTEEWKEEEKILLSSQIRITVHLTLRVGSNPSHVTPYFIFGWNRWNAWFGMKEGSEPPGCILYLTSFSSEYTWVLFNGPNGHWVTPGQPSNTLFKSHNTQAQDLWTRTAKA